MIYKKPITPVALRHLLHQNPELMFNEFETTKILYDNLKLFPSIIIHKPLETGLIVEYTVNEKPYILFRADIDALPIEEKTNCSFSSTNKYMHACGHDVHTSILYGLIKEIIINKINQNIIFVFQPAEEGGGGAEKLFASNIFNNYKIKNAFALHVTDEYDFGTIASTSGILFASSVELNLVVIGKAAHVAFSDAGIDSIKVLRLILDKIEKIISLQEKPVLFGCGKIEGGTARNILAAQAQAECTLRATSIDKIKVIVDEIKKQTINIEKKTKAQISIQLNSFYTEVNVNPLLYNKIKSALDKSYKFIDCGMKMTAEDFGLFTKNFPSFMFWLGTSTGKKNGLHTPYFLPDDKIINKGIEIFLKILKSLN